MTWLVQHTRLRRAITAQLESAFGRPVEVGSYSFSAWGGPSLQANLVTVAEDPRFGQEYFLRAESVTIRLRWQSLLAGRLELGTLSFSRPSMNLTRNAAGQWNVQEWLPQPAGTNFPGSPNAAGRGGSGRLRRVEVDSGRINFKLGSDKLPFALTGVTGWVEHEGDSRWQVNLDAIPGRIAVALQQIGTLHLEGRIGGTSSRLRPAELTLSWTEGSLSDLLRLVKRDDAGLRGLFSLRLMAETAGPDWNFMGSAALENLHRWDIAPRPDNPSLSLQASARFLPSQARLELTKFVADMPRSSIQADGEFFWGRSPAGAEGAPSQSIPRLHVSSAGIALSDVLAWLRAFHAGVAEEMNARGNLRFDGTLAGWPPRIESAFVSTEGAQLEGEGLQAPVSMSRATWRIERGRLSGEPLAIGFEPADGLFRVQASAERQTRWQTVLRLTGQMAQSEDLFQTSAALGWSLPAGWEVHGPSKFDIREQVAGLSFGRPEGKIEVDGVSLGVPFLNEPITEIRGVAEMRASEQRITVAEARAFGTLWTAGFVRHVPEREWTCAISAEELNGAELNRWLNPRQAEGFLQRILPFFGPSPAISAPLLNALACRGGVSADHVTIGPFEFHHLHGELHLTGRRLELNDATAEVGHGAVHGALAADLAIDPSYRLTVGYSHVDLASLTGSMPSLEATFGGVASGEIIASFNGAEREAMGQSLDCRGKAEILKPKVHGINLLASMEAGAIEPGTSAFIRAAGEFSCADGAVHFLSLTFFAPGKILHASGSVDYGRNFDLQLSLEPGGISGSKPSPKSNPETVVHLAGHLPSALPAERPGVRHGR